MKKSILTLGTIAAVAAPVAAVVSCGVIVSKDNGGSAKGSQVVWNQKTNTASFNLINSATKDPFAPFISGENGTIPVLDIAQKMEAAMGYSYDIQGENINPKNVKKLKPGTLVKVNVGMQYKSTKEPDKNKETELKELKKTGYDITISFPFYTLEDINSVSKVIMPDKELKIYEAFKPYGIHTNILKSLIIAFGSKLGVHAKKASSGNFARLYTTGGTAGLVKSWSGGDQIYTSTGQLWQNELPLVLSDQNTKAVYDVYGNSKEIIKVTNTDLMKRLVDL